MSSRLSNDWKPGSYLVFKNERAQPSIDLVNRIGAENPKSIIDIGCGPGNSAEILRKRWPAARITGVDSSPAMIAEAQKSYPDIEWRLQDAADLDMSEQYDVVFSNATIQWIPDHGRLLKGFADITNNGGIIAVQMPLYNEMPIAKMIDEIFHDLFPDSDFSFDSVFTFHEPRFYYETLSAATSRVELWETSYYHLMSSHKGIYDMVESTGMRPYFERISDDSAKSIFIERVIKGLEKIYPAAADGMVLFPFKRLFMLAAK